MVAGQKRKPRWKALTLLFVFFAGVGAAVFFTSPLSKIRSVQVIGNSQIPADQIASASGVIVGMNFWDVKPENVDKQVREQYPLIAKADVEVKFPGHVTIAVAEKPVAAVLVRNGGMFYRLLSDATVYDAIKNTNGTNLPLIIAQNTLEVEPGKQIPDRDVQEFCEQLVSVDRKLLEHISHFEIRKKEDKKENLWSAWTVEGFEIRFPPGNLATTLDVYMKFWKKELEGKLPGIIYIYSEDEAWYDSNRGEQQPKKE
ncbi:cell division protein FtsQ/DivIB [Effusibacillus lacus]|uniref:POTRA domain-containing protein n=1 Tax=Effusibacillus lacus TaxID=1348429 RepID=A0A292YQG8_9BACL|nr:FtsQ-type POTRA domain-containing protein [Effusibacillus lacus]TCS75682.1 cell division septal protein FtsQ [Effusibacillus lacus]GAX91003.1 hypothetical protein EFBL_2663 [Effusibacillus lacus]